MDFQAIQPILEQSIAGTSLAEAQWQMLVDWELSDRRRAAAWQIEPQQARDLIAERLHWLHQMEPLMADLPLPSKPFSAYLPLAWQLWLPLAAWIAAARQGLDRPLILGILGGQGTGKTTLTLILQRLLKEMGYNAVGLSIDDLYKTYADRQQIRQQDPRLIWRGPPGTHDVDLGVETLTQIRQAASDQTVRLPRFDKSLHGGEGDRAVFEAVTNVDVLLFEGWFMGVRPVDDLRLFDQTLPPITTEADRQFARDMNRQLEAYLPLWDLLDRLMVLCPEDFRISQQWRRQAEQQMRAQGKTGMSDDTIDQFVAYFWKALHPELFITPLRQQREWVDLVVEISPDRIPSAIYCP